MFDFTIDDTSMFCENTITENNMGLFKISTVYCSPPDIMDIVLLPLTTTTADAEIRRELDRVITLRTLLMNLMMKLYIMHCRILLLI
jgi:hypothetical protein